MTLKKSLMITAIAAVGFVNISSLSLAQSLPATSTNNLCAQTSSDTAFERFNCAPLMEAMWHGDISILRHHKALVLAYLTKFANVVHEPDIGYRIGAQMQANLDPRILPHLRYKLATDPAFMGEAATEGFGALINGLKSWATERRSQQQSGRLDPIGEFTALNRGLYQSRRPITLSAIEAEQDARIWVAIAQEDPDAAMQFYRGLQTLAYSL